MGGGHGDGNGRPCRVLAAITAVCQTLFGDICLITSYFKLMIHFMCKRFLCTQKRNFSLIWQKI